MASKIIDQRPDQLRFTVILERKLGGEGQLITVMVNQDDLDEEGRDSDIHTEVTGPRDVGRCLARVFQQDFTGMMKEPK